MPDRIEGPTPNGGAYAEVYCKDADGNLVDKAEAESVEIIEFDAEGKAIHRIQAVIGDFASPASKSATKAISPRDRHEREMQAALQAVPESGAKSGTFSDDDDATNT